MKHLNALLILLLYSGAFIAQCPECTPDETCGAGEDFPTVCPEFMPPATAGAYYEDYLTFFMPETVIDPGSGVEATLLEVVITNVQGLPFGIDFTMNNENSTYYPNQGENYGCATVCGTPLLAGNYNVIITAHVLAEAFGFETEVDQNFISPFTVLPGNGENTSFTYDNIAGCGTLDVNFEALINADPQPTTYFWDFGNGSTSVDQFPPTQTYNEVGELTVSLETTLWNNVLTTLMISSVGDGWGGDIDEGFGLLNPDPYFVLVNGDGSAVYTSGSLTDVTSGSWSSINQILDNPPYTIEFYDEDAITADDYLGSWTLPTTDGTFILQSGGNNGSVSINLQAGDVFYNEEIVIVFELPNAEFVVDEDANLLSYDDPLLESYIWTMNGDTVPDNNGPVLEMSPLGGVYQCLVTNIYGCEAWSDPYTHCPEFAPSFDSETGILSAPGGFTSYQWYFNGLPIDGETETTVMIEELGNYAVEVTTDFGCTSLSNVYTLTSVEEIVGLISAEVYPNPSSGIVQLRLNTRVPVSLNVQLISLEGKIVQADQLQVSGSSNSTLNFTDLPAGAYILVLRNKTGMYQCPLILQ